MDDAFGVQRCYAYQIARDLLEAWTLEEKERIIAQMREKRQAELVDHVQIAEYDLVLWCYTRSNTYAVSLNVGHEDPTTLDGQKQRPKPQTLPWYDVVSQLQRWVEQYGKLLIGSAIGTKTKKYRRLLHRHFLIGDWKEHPGDGFYLMPD